MHCSWELSRNWFSQEHRAYQLMLIELNFERRGWVKLLNYSERVFALVEGLLIIPRLTFSPSNIGCPKAALDCVWHPLERRTINRMTCHSTCVHPDTYITPEPRYMHNKLFATYSSVLLLSLLLEAYKNPILG